MTQDSPGEGLLLNGRSGDGIVSRHAPAFPKYVFAVI